MTNTELCDQLNAYTGDNIWQDILYEALTAEEWEAADDSSDRFTRDGDTIRREAGEWVVV